MSQVGTRLRHVDIQRIRRCSCQTNDRRRASHLHNQHSVSKNITYQWLYSRHAFAIFIAHVVAPYKFHFISYLLSYLNTIIGKMTVSAQLK